MMTIALVVSGERLEIELDTVGAPGLSAALTACLPHDTIAIHTQIAGLEFCVPVPFFHWHENRRVPITGDVGYASFGNYICFYYGAMLPVDGPTNVIGRVRDPGCLTRIGEGLLAAGAASARLVTTEGLNPMPSRPTGASSASAPARGSSSFVRASAELLKMTLARPPLAIEELRRTTLPAMGNLAGRLQASGFLAGLAESLFLLRARLVNDPTVPPLLLDMLAETLGRYVRWLTMSGMESVASQLAVIARSGLHDSSRDEVLTGIETLLVAVSRFRLWVDAVCPWHAVQKGFADESWLAPDLWEDAAQ
jgi:hypothetical protein